MRNHVANRVVFRFLHIFDFAQVHVSLPLDGIVNGVLGAEPNILRVRIISNPQLQSQYRPQRNKGVEHDVIPDDPRRAAQPGNDQGNQGLRDPVAALLAAPVGEPTEKEWQ